MDLNWTKEFIAINPQKMKGLFQNKEEEKDEIK